MKIKFEKEIWKCFKEQYPEKEKSYTKLLRGNYDAVFEGVKVYEDMVETFTLLINLIVKLKNKNRFTCS